MGVLLPSIPKYRQLKETLANEIQTGRYVAGARIASENELVRTYGVSKHTVLKALTELVNEGLLCREQGRGTFVTGRPQRSDGTPVGAIGAVIPILGGELTLSPAFRTLGGMSQEVDSCFPGRHLLLRNSSGDAELEAEQLEALRRARVAGVLVFPGFTSSERTVAALHHLREDGIPFVLIDHRLPGSFDFVGTDDRKGARILVEHLQQQGHRHIAHVTLPGKWFKHSTPAQDRAAGYREALQNAGVDFRERWIQYRTGDDCAPAVEQILRLRPRPSALFAVDAFTCLQVYGQLRVRGLRIPEDIALAGFDDVPAARLLDIPLTMLEQDFHQLGVLAVRRLSERMANGTSAPREILLEPQLRVRRSTGA